jgi:peroxiredoxin
MISRYQLLVPLLVLFAIVSLVAGCQTTNASKGSTIGSDSSTAVKKAPDFSIKTLAGNKFSFSEVKGKPVVINFAASWCAPCEIEAPVLAKMYAKYKDKVTFLGIAVKDTEEDQRAFAQRHGLTFTIGLDPTGNILYDYQKAGKVAYSGIPTTFFIDKEGNIADFFIGPLSEKTFDQKISAILK